VVRKVSIFTAKGTSIRGSMSFETFRVPRMKIGWGCGLQVQQVGWGKIKQQTSYISHIYPEAPAALIVTKFVFMTDVQDIINFAKFHYYPFRGFDFVGSRNWHFS